MSTFASSNQQSSTREGQLKQQSSFKEGQLSSSDNDSLKKNYDQTGQGFQKQLQGAQPLQGPGIAGGSFNSASGVGVVNLKPICIEQEPVMYRPQPLTIPQPPLMVQPEPISIPQPPIVIHPEPIVIPQPPLTFQPPPVAVARPPITVQPEPVVLNRPAYSVQPTVQFDLTGCNKFNQPDFKQHVHVKLTGQSAIVQQQGQQGMALQQGQQQQQQQGFMKGGRQWSRFSRHTSGKVSHRIKKGWSDLKNKPAIGLTKPLPAQQWYDRQGSSFSYGQL